jgi:RNA-directed DNA polymerase
MNQNNEEQPTPVPRVEGAKQAGDPRDPWWWVERSVWTERMLTRLTSGESADRVWFRLWDKTYAPVNLDRAFGQVWQNDGSAGVDQQTVAYFGRHAQPQTS